MLESFTWEDLQAAAGLVGGPVQSNRWAGGRTLIQLSAAKARVGGRELWDVRAFVEAEPGRYTWVPFEDLALPKGG